MKKLEDANKLEAAVRTWKSKTYALTVPLGVAASHVALYLLHGLRALVERDVGRDSTNRVGTRRTDVGTGKRRDVGTCWWMRDSWAVWE